MVLGYCGASDSDKDLDLIRRIDYGTAQPEVREYK